MLGPLNLEFFLQSNFLGNNPDNLQWLAERMKHLPRNLKNLTLKLSNNDLLKNIKNLQWLAEGIKYLPNNL